MFSDLFTNRYPTEKLLCLYIQPENPFVEIESFIRECEEIYRIRMECIRGTVKSSLFEICQRYPVLKTVVMGSRRTDPYCGDLNPFQVILTKNILCKLKCLSTVDLHILKIFLYVCNTEYRCWLATFNACQSIT